MAATETTTEPVLEPAAKAFADATANHPFLFVIPVAEGRKAVDDVQSGTMPFVGGFPGHRTMTSGLWR